MAALAGPPSNADPVSTRLGLDLKGLPPSRLPGDAHVTGHFEKQMSAEGRKASGRKPLIQQGLLHRLIPRGEGTAPLLDQLPGKGHTVRHADAAAVSTREPGPR